jgi:quercetin dioxygenase-like cupin family protein
MAVKNVSEAQVFDDGRMRKETLFEEAGSSAFVVNLMPGQELPAHRHPGQQVYLFLFEGEGEYSLDGEHHPFSLRDVLHCGQEQELSLKNTGFEPMSVFVVKAKLS